MEGVLMRNYSYHSTSNTNDNNNAKIDNNNAKIFKNQLLGIVLSTYINLLPPHSNPIIMPIL